MAHLTPRSMSHFAEVGEDGYGTACAEAVLEQLSTASLLRALFISPTISLFICL
jgi:hypothetical protein